MDAVNRVVGAGLWVISSVIGVLGTIISKVAKLATSFFARQQNAPPAEVDLQELGERVRAAQEEAEEFGRQAADRAQSINRQAARLGENLPAREPTRPSPPEPQQPTAPAKQPKNDIEKQRVGVQVKLRNIEEALENLRRVPEKESPEDKRAREQRIKLYEIQQKTLRSLGKTVGRMEKSLQEGRELLVAEAAVGQMAKWYGEGSEARMQRLAKEAAGL